jgi:hypothetical protein
MEACEYTIVFGGSADMHGIMRNKKWKYCAPVKMCYLNRGRTIYAGDSWPKATLKRVLNALRRRSLSEFAAQSSDPGITVVEETNYSADLLPSRSEFRFRFTPTVEYLNWRYSTRLSFAHYRLFRILRDKETIGYVIIQEFADRLVVAQCDGSSALELAAGVMTAILKVGSNDVKPRSVILSCSHSEMLKAYEEFGVDTSTEERPLVIGAPDGQVDIEDDNSRWLINFDWGDNGLRAPFPD